MDDQESDKMERADNPSRRRLLEKFGLLATGFLASRAVPAAQAPAGQAVEAAPPVSEAAKPPETQTGAAEVYLGVTRKETRLPNGVEVIHFEKEYAPLFVDVIFTGAGQSSDPVGKEGTTHFLEHILTSGTPDIPSKDELANKMSPAGFSARTGEDYMAFRLQVSSPTDEYLDRAFSVLGDMLKHPVYSDTQLPKELNSIMLERKGYTQTRTSGLLLLYLLKRGSMSGRILHADEPTLQKITEDDLKDCYSSRIGADTMRVVSSGGVSMEKITEMIQRHLELPNTLGSQMTEADVPEDLLDKRLGENVMIKDRLIAQKDPKEKQVFYTLGFKVPGKDSPDYYPLLLVESMLNGRGGLLQQELRYKAGLAYSMSMGIGESRQGSYLTIGSISDAPKMDEVKSILTNLFDSMSGEKADNEKLGRLLDIVKANILENRPSRFETSVSWVDYFSALKVQYPHMPWQLAGLDRKLEEVTLDDVKRVCGQYLNPGQMYWSLFGNVDSSSL